MRYKISDLKLNDKKQLESLKINFLNLESNRINKFSEFLRKAFTYFNEHKEFPPIPEPKSKKEETRVKGKILFEG